jgi:hypothetical protein
MSEKYTTLSGMTRGFIKKDLIDPCVNCMKLMGMLNINTSGFLKISLTEKTDIKNHSKAL